MLLQGMVATVAVGTAPPSETRPPEIKVPDVKAPETKPATMPVIEAEDAIVEGVTVQSAPRGKTDSPVEPEVSLDEAAIKAYGAGSVAELMTMLEPLTVSSRGRGGEGPVTLVNGQRISGFQEIAGLPPEAVQRMDILREEAALAYGYRADQRVVNLILKKDFRSLNLEDEFRFATEGGRTFNEQKGNLFKVDADARWTVNVRYRRETPLYEAERDIVRTSSTPYDIQGNIGTATGPELDPALSALAGSVVTVASVPASFAGGAPSLADFVAGAGRAATDDLTASRTLLARGEEGAVQGSYTRNLVLGALGNVTTTFSGNVESTSRVSFNGLTGVSLALKADSPYSPFARDVALYRYLDVPDGLRRKTDTDKFEAGMTALGMMAGWRWTFAGNYDLTDTANRTGRGLDTAAYRAAVAASDPQVDPFGPIPTGLLRYAAQDTADSITTNAKAELTMNGTVAQLPAGRLRATVKGGVDSRKVEAESVRSGVFTRRTLTRDRGTLSASADAPLAERDGVLGFLGGVSVNGNLLYEQFSDIGGLMTAGGGLSWSPVKRMNLSLNYSTEEGEPSPQQVNDPVLLTPNVAMYDFATNQTVNVTRIEGGNPNLGADSRQVVKLGFNYRPFEKRELSLWGNYTASRVEDQIASFPAVSPELEAAFPSRFVRDATGRLTSVDTRPVNFAHADRQELRWGLNYNLRWGGPPPAAPGGRPGGGGQAGGPGFMMRPGGQPGQGFLNVSLNHLWRLQDEVVIRDGMTPLDLLDGASLGRRGGTPRHEVNLQANLAKDGLGCGLRSAWRSATWVDGGPRGDDLFFADIPTVSLSGFADLGQRKDLVQRYDWLKGSRVTLAVDNLFDEKQQVRDDQGRTPQAYQEDYMDAMGRTVRLSLRKLL
ncbi:TonB-dependent receptor plug domain-containing protein [Caulobacter endophyticus]|uniref:TonB-dependent receptor plug domain-containing protein n=1 Tax=Caulobacter endophyticus TaxID=2172652 RepID=UPI00240EAE73|nr:TonB-dependent receptor plug domain-containing protein [Caulobacter endophyticus]MDG2530747.1 TonB-dependent receptor plug domain-containing protein [Caulobacter endophyticus]